MVEVIFRVSSQIREIVGTVTELINYIQGVQLVTRSQRDDAVKRLYDIRDTTWLGSVGLEPTYLIRERLRKTIQSKKME